MALRKCPEPDCGNMVSTRAEFCPRCGHPLDSVDFTDLETEVTPVQETADPLLGAAVVTDRPVVRLKVPAAKALELVRRIPHSKCQRAVPNNWKVDRSGNVTPESVDWLYCWAKTGMNSQRAADFAKQVFDAIFNMSYADYDAHVDHEEARRNRYR
jgi:hypothetical protein